MGSRRKPGVLKISELETIATSSTFYFKEKDALFGIPLGFKDKISLEYAALTHSS